MADKTGYIGRAPGDSAVTVARQTFSPTGVTTDFTFASGYVTGYFDIFLNGVKMIEGSDYTSTDGSTFSILNGGAENGDVIEAVAYKAFNAATIDSAPGNFTVGGNLTVNGTASFSGAGSSVSFATTAYALEGTPDITVRNVTGVAATFTGAADFNNDVDIDGHTELDNLNVSGFSTFVGFSTFNDYVFIQDGLNVGGISTFNGNIVANGAINFGGTSNLTLGDNNSLHVGTGNDLRILHSGGDSVINHAGTDGEFALLTTNEVRITNTGFAKTAAVFKPAGATELYHNHSKKFETTTDGVVITGIATATGVDATGIVTATSFVGSGANLTNLPASGDSNDITACLFI